MKTHGFAPFKGLADAPVEGGEGGPGADEAAGDCAPAHDDAAVRALAHTIAGLEHGAHEGQPGVAAHEWPAGAGGAGGKRGEPDDGHLAGVLVAVDQCDGIGAGGQGGGGILFAVADVPAVDTYLPVDGAGPLKIAGDGNIHNSRFRIAMKSQGMIEAIVDFVNHLLGSKYSMSYGTNSSKMLYPKLEMRKGDSLEFLDWLYIGYKYYRFEDKFQVFLLSK